MSSVVSRIHNHTQSLTPSESKVAEYCLRDPERASSQTIGELARRSGVSTASVSRLAATLGYADWKRMRLALAKAAAADDPDNDATAAFTDIRPGDSDIVVARKIFEADAGSLRETFAQIDGRALVRAAGALARTERIVFFGVGASSCLAGGEAWRFSRLAVRAEARTEESEMLITAARMRRGEVAVGFSDSGRGRATVAALREARRRRALTIGIANYRNIPLAAAAELFFCTSFPRPPGVDADASMTARVAATGIMDALYALTLRHGGAAADLAEIDASLERNLRLPPGEGRRKATSKSNAEFDRERTVPNGENDIRRGRGRSRGGGLGGGAGTRAPQAGRRGL